MPCSNKRVSRESNGEDSEDLSTDGKIMHALDVVVSDPAFPCVEGLETRELMPRTDHLTTDEGHS